MRVRYLFIYFCWLICATQVSADVHFTENGLEYSSLIPGQCGQFCVEDTTDVVMLKGYVSSYSFDIAQPLHIPASVVHNGKCYRVKEIGEYALAGLPGIETIVLDEGIEKIDAYAICNSTNLRSVFVPASVNNIHNNLFMYCPNLSELVVAPDNEVYDSRNHCNAIICDEELVAGCNGTKIPTSVKEIEGSAFYGRNGLEGIIIPEGVISIGICAFADCSSLRRISLPSSLEEVKQDAFINCTLLDSVFIPKQVKKIHNNIFAGCTRLSSIIVDAENATYHSNCNGIVNRVDSLLIAACNATFINSDIKKLDNGCFRGVNVRSVKLSQSIEELDMNAFSDYANIDSLSVASENPYYMSPEGSNVILTKDEKSLIMGCRTSIIPKGIEYIEDGAFYGRYSNSLLKLPDGLKEIGEGAFAECNKINSIILPSSVSSIGCHAFARCNRIVEIIIPEGAKTIKDYAFENCEQLANIYLPSSIETIGLSAFENCHKLSGTNIPNGIKEIKLQTFKDCKNLKHVKLPSSLEYIEYAAFQNCRSLEEVIIPEGVKIIGKRAFKDCVNLKRVTLPSTIERIEEDAFTGCPCEESVKRFLKHRK